ncbi:ubiquitin-conjugating enzyme E2 U isoform X2 [Dasypus novemcinctus]|uniref:ubiquitin-conjugating enzyme E2 U isoform X2 n=1 Tax=Dasypus novemcinctus TaxID=9361 RepID=UPI00265FF59F|nr:ubiquitin-conjugating enzyme E2 U isoform X2 [Dasypus novemcinctus]
MTHNLKYLSQSKCEFRDERCYITRRRAYLLLLKDLKELKKSNFKGITAFPVSEDFMEWEAEIEGLQDTIWHGLFFQLMIHFTWAYNFVPPVVRFITIPFHPNVDQHTGQPCIEFLDNPNKWSTNYTLSSILLNLQVMLSNPVVENPVNLEAAELLIKDENLYKTVVLRLFQQPLQLKDDSSELPKDQHTFTRSIKAIPFNDYYKTWFGIATSKATEYHRAPCLLLLCLGLIEKVTDLKKPNNKKKHFISAQLQIKLLLSHLLKQILSQRLIQQKRVRSIKLHQSVKTLIVHGKKKWTIWLPGSTIWIQIS